MSATNSPGADSPGRATSSLGGGLFLDLLFEEPRVGRCLVAPDGHVLRANRDWLRSIGQDDAASPDVIDLFRLLVGDRDRSLAMHARLRDGQRVEVPRRFQRVDGQDTWWEGTVDPVPMDGGMGLLFTTREVPRDPGRGEAELALRASDARRLADESSVMLWVTGANDDNEFVNRAYHDFFGVAYEELKGTGWRSFIHPEDAPEYLKALQRATRTDAPFSAEARFRRKDGAWRWIASYGQPRYPETGKFSGHLGVSVDITDRKVAEEALRKSEERFRLLVQGVRDCAIYMLGPDGTVTSWSAAAEQIFGYREEEIVGRHRSVFFTEEDQRAEMPRLELEQAATHGHHEHEAWRVRKDGSRFWGNVLITALRDDAGGVRGFATVHRDFTERKKIEAALRESEARYRSLFEHMSDGLAHCRMLFEGERPVDFVFLDVNPMFEALSGLKDVVGKKVSEVLPGFQESDPGLLDRYGKVARLGAPDRFETYVNAVGRWFDISVYSHAPGDFVTVFDNITERKRAEEALREQERRYRWLFENSLDAVYVTRHSDGVILDANPAACALHGMSVEEIRQRGRAGLVAADDLLAEGMVRRALHGEARTELNLLRKDGTIFPAEVESMIVGSDGSEFTAFVIARDITERKRAEEELRAADRRKTEFLAVLSHELRNPLAPLRNSIYLLEHGAAGSEQAAHAKQVIRRQMEHLSRLVDDLLDVTRISRGKITLQRARVDLCEIVRRTTDDLQSLFAHARVDLCVDRVFGPVWIDGDRTRIAQVIGNLLQNAVKFTPGGGTVTVTLVQKGARAELRVRDTGVGMVPEAVAHMFEPFVQAEMTLARTKGGLGLGLALVKGLVELHGGTVEARSDGPGLGSEFLVRLPLAEAGTEETRGHHAPAEAVTEAILIIEDNLDAGDTLAEVLTLQGHRVRVARDGRSGLALARETHPDVVLCDIGLPDIDGYEVARELRRDQSLRATRLIAVSGYAQPEDRQRAREAGFDAHIAKPADLDTLTDVIAERR